MKRLRMQRNLSGFMTFLSLFLILGIAGTSDNGMFTNSGLLFAMVSVLLAVAVLSGFAFRAAGCRMRRRAKILTIRREQTHGGSAA